LKALKCFEAQNPVHHKDVVHVVEAILASWAKQKQFKECMTFARILAFRRQQALGRDHTLTQQAREATVSYAEQWELHQMFQEDAVGQRLTDEAAKGAAAAAAAARAGRYIMNFFLF
jgi:hypothetical protein